MAATLRTAVITGTAKPHGIGRATARAFVAAGWQATAGSMALAAAVAAPGHMQELMALT